MEDLMVMRVTGNIGCATGDNLQLRLQIGPQVKANRIAEGLIKIAKNSGFSLLIKNYLLDGFVAG
jgi:hypothetical protein